MTGSFSYNKSTVYWVWYQRLQLPEGCLLDRKKDYWSLIEHFDYIGIQHPYSHGTVFMSMK